MTGSGARRDSADHTGVCSTFVRSSTINSGSMRMDIGGVGTDGGTTASGVK